MPIAKNIKIEGEIKAGETLFVSYEYEGTNPEGNTQFQRYRNNNLIVGETGQTYTIEITDHTSEIVCAIQPIDNQGVIGEIAYSEILFVSLYDLEAKTNKKQYIFKLYDKNQNFLKAIQNSIITSDITFKETINSGQGDLDLTLNLPIDTNFFDDVRFIKIFVSDETGIENQLLFTGYLSKFTRNFSNNKENIQATFLSLFSLFSDVIFKDQSGNTEFTIGPTDPSNIIKSVVDCVSESFPGLFSYTNETIEEYGNLITIESKNKQCSKIISSVLQGLSFYLFIGADGIVHFHQKPTTATHYFTYGKDIETLQIPEDFEKISNAVRVEYGEKDSENYGFTDRAVNQDSIDKFGRIEKTVTNSDLFNLSSAIIYRDEYLAKNSGSKQNITLTVNDKFQIEKVHPGQTIAIRNLYFDFGVLQVYSVQYQYEKIKIKLEHSTSLGDEILSLTQ